MAETKVLPFRAATDGETVRGKSTGTIQLSSGKLAIVERSQTTIERQLRPGRELMRGSERDRLCTTRIIHNLLHGDAVPAHPPRHAFKARCIKSLSRPTIGRIFDKFRSPGSSSMLAQSNQNSCYQAASTVLVLSNRLLALSTSSI